MNRTWNIALSILGGGAAVTGGYFAYTKWQDYKADNKPERELPKAAAPSDFAPSSPSEALPSSGKKRIDALLPKLQQAAHDSGIPLGLIVGWILKESAGKLNELTRLDERGYFQIHPDESKALKLDHTRLSTDSDYSIQSGIRLIQHYMEKANKLAAAPFNTTYYWKLVKLLHTMGSGATKKIIDIAKQAGSADSWEALRKYATDNDRELLSQTKHSPAKWFPLVDAVYKTGLPFGFGTETSSPLVAGNTFIGYAEPNKNDADDDRLPFNPLNLINPLDIEALARALESAGPLRSLKEKQAIAWVCRNRADHLHRSVHKMLCPEGAYGPLGEAGRTFCSTRLDPSDEARRIAKAVLALPPDADPTSGAIDFWLPHEQVLALAQGGPSLKEAREKLSETGLRVCDTVGKLELLKATA